MIKLIGAVLAGLAVAILSIFAIENVNLSLYPVPTNLDTSNENTFAAYVESLPVMAKLIVLLAHAIGAVLGGYISAMIAKVHQAKVALSVGVLLLGAVITNLMLIPHPMWFMVVDVLMILPLAYLGSRFAPEE